MWEGPGVGLQRLDLEAERLGDYYLLPAARADLLRRLGRTDDAAAQYHRAIELAPTAPERRYLERRLREVTLR